MTSRWCFLLLPPVNAEVASRIPAPLKSEQVTVRTRLATLNERSVKMCGNERRSAGRFRSLMVGDGWSKHSVMGYVPEPRQENHLLILNLKIEHLNLFVPLLKWVLLFLLFCKYCAVLQISSLSMFSINIWLKQWGAVRLSPNTYCILQMTHLHISSANSI